MEEPSALPHWEPSELIGAGLRHCCPVLSFCHIKRVWYFGVTRSKQGGSSLICGCWLTVTVSYLDRAAGSTAESPVCPSLPPSQLDTLRLPPPRTGTCGAATPIRRHSFGSTATTATRGRDHLWRTAATLAQLCVPRQREEKRVSHQTETGDGTAASRLPLRTGAVGAVVPGRRVDAGVGPDLPSSPAGHRAVGPHGPGRPAAVHWSETQG